MVHDKRKNNGKARAGSMLWKALINYCRTNGQIRLCTFEKFDVLGQCLIGLAFSSHFTADMSGQWIEDTVSSPGLASFILRNAKAACALEVSLPTLLLAFIGTSLASSVA